MFCGDFVVVFDFLLLVLFLVTAKLLMRFRYRGSGKHWCVVCKDPLKNGCGLLLSTHSLLAFRVQFMCSDWACESLACLNICCFHLHHFDPAFLIACFVGFISELTYLSLGSENSFPMSVVLVCHSIKISKWHGTIFLLK